MQVLILRLCVQISSWWGGSSAPTPAAPEKPFDPTDPKQNPLNPKGLKPYVPTQSFPQCRKW